MKSGIYAIQCMIDGKLYIGSSIDIEKRLRDHNYYLRKGAHINPKLQRAWNKHGKHNFVQLVIERVYDTSQLLTREQYWLDELDAYNCGYNIASVAGKVSFTADVRRKMSEAAKGRKSHLGCKHTDETKQLLSKLAKEQSINPITQQRRSQAEQTKWANPSYRAEMSNVHKRKVLIRDARGRIVSIKANRLQKNVTDGLPEASITSLIIGQ